MKKCTILLFVFFFAHSILAQGISSAVTKTVEGFKKSGEKYFILYDGESGTYVINYCTTSRGAITSPREITGYMLVNKSGIPFEESNENLLCLSALVAYCGTTPSSTIYRSQTSYWNIISNDAARLEQKYDDALKVGTAVSLIKLTDEFLGMITPGKGMAVENALNYLRKIVAGTSTRTNLDSRSLSRHRDEVMRQKALIGKIKTNARLLFECWSKINCTGGSGESARTIVMGKYGTKDPLAVSVYTSFHEALGCEERKLSIAGFSSSSSIVKAAQKAQADVWSIVQIENGELNNIRKIQGQMAALAPVTWKQRRTQGAQPARVDTPPTRAGERENARTAAVKRLSDNELAELICPGKVISSFIIDGNSQETVVAYRGKPGFRVKTRSYSDVSTGRTTDLNTIAVVGKEYADLTGDGREELVVVTIGDDQNPPDCMANRCLNHVRVYQWTGSGYGEMWRTSMDLGQEGLFKNLEIRSVGGKPQICLYGNRFFHGNSQDFCDVWQWNGKTFAPAR